MMTRGKYAERAGSVNSALASLARADAPLFAKAWCEKSSGMYTLALINSAAFG